MDFSRREWVQLVGAAGMGLGLRATGTRLFADLDSQETIPGISTWYATTCRECPAGCGMIVRCREGHAVKCEGNPDHPINRGRLCARGQAAIFGLYDPDRVRGPMHQKRGAKPEATSWDSALAAVGALLAPLRSTGRVAVISDLQTGALAELICGWLQALGAGPEHHLVYEPLNYAALRRGDQIAFGQDTLWTPRLDEADFILSFGADFLDTWVSPVAFAAQFAEMHALRDGRMGRFVYVWPRVSLTGANADERLLVRPEHLGHLAGSMLNVIMREGLAKRPEPLLTRLCAACAPAVVAPVIGVRAEDIVRVAWAFARARRPLALAGAPLGESPQAVETVVAANLLNYAVGASAGFGPRHALADCANAARIEHFVKGLSGGVDLLLIIGANPLYSLPANHGLRQLIEQGAKTVVSLSPYLDETAAAADWVLPSSHPLESWGDYEPEAGVRSIIQPTMRTVFDTRSTGDILWALQERSVPMAQTAPLPRTFYEYCRNWCWRAKFDSLSGQDFDAYWTEMVQRGGEWSEAPSQPPSLSPNLTRFSFSQPQHAQGLTLHAYPSMTLYDGRGANKAWLQELPDPMTHAVWGSWVEVGLPEAETLRIAERDQEEVVELSAGGNTARVPVFPNRLLAPGVAAIPLGQGHTAYGRYANGVGVNALPWLWAPGADSLPVTLKRVHDREPIVTTDGGVTQDGRRIVQTIELAQIGHEPREHLHYPVPAGYDSAHDLYPSHDHPEHRWGMIIDLHRCTGCSACMTACQAENNFPAVGRKQMQQGREMFWLRLDRYYESSAAAPVLFVPILCQQCDAGPCESVCPVYAAHHTDDGLNAQIYNRCIGTRYCSHNCPYKVRRFNWFNRKWPEPLNWQLNPDVAVRCRGVMEKCTFCVQRIREVERRAKAEERPLREGEIVPACAQTCPTEAILFGDLKDPRSQVSRLMLEDPRAYQVLGELNTKPAVIYLKRVTQALSP